jgi:hypothetical protein
MGGPQIVSGLVAEIGARGGSQGATEAPLHRCESRNATPQRANQHNTKPQSESAIHVCWNRRFAQLHEAVTVASATLISAPRIADNRRFYFCACDQTLAGRRGSRFASKFTSASMLPVIAR